MKRLFPSLLRTREPEPPKDALVCPKCGDVRPRGHRDERGVFHPSFPHYGLKHTRPNRAARRRWK